MIAALKRFAALLPRSWQHELRRAYFRRQIRARTFATDEKEYAILHTLLRPGDWALDIGANVGHYTLRMSELVGAAGRVIAVEPVPETFTLLAANVRLFEHANVSLLNFAVSDRMAVLGMDMPQLETGLANYYQAKLTQGAGGVTVLTLPMDALPLPGPVRLVKMDVEGHELPALHGMRRLLERDHPALVVETSGRETIDFLKGMGYAVERLPGSSNVLCRWATQAVSS